MPGIPYFLEIFVNTYCNEAVGIWYKNVFVCISQRMKKNLAY